MNSEQIKVSISKLKFTDADIALIKCPSSATTSRVMEIVRAVSDALPEGINIVAVDADFDIIATNAPEVFAMLERRHAITH